MASLWKVFTDAFKKASTPTKPDAREEARTHGLLGPTTQDAGGSFTPIQRTAPGAGGPGPEGELEPIAPLADGATDTVANQATDKAVVDAAVSNILKSQSEIAQSQVRNIRREAPAEGGEPDTDEVIAPSMGDGLGTDAMGDFENRVKTSDKAHKAMTDFVKGREAPPEEDPGDLGPRGDFGGIAGRRSEVKDAHDKFSNTVVDADDEPATLVNLSPRGGDAGIGTRPGALDGPPEAEDPAQLVSRASSDPEEGGEYKIADVVSDGMSGDTVVHKTQVPDWKSAAEQKLADDLKLEDYKFQTEVKTPQGDQKIQRVVGGGDKDELGEHKVADMATAHSGEDVVEGVGEAPSDIPGGTGIDPSRFGADLSSADGPRSFADQRLGRGPQRELQQVWGDGETEDDGGRGRPEPDEDDMDGEAGTLVDLRGGRSVADQLAASRERLEGADLGDLDTDLDDDIDDDVDF